MVAKFGLTRSYRTGLEFLSIDDSVIKMSIFGLVFDNKVTKLYTH